MSQRPVRIAKPQTEEKWDAALRRRNVRFGYLACMC